MRRLLLSALLAASVSGLYAQKLDDVQDKISKGKYDEAKEKIDKILEDPKNQNNANAWYYKGKVYTELARRDSMGTLNYDAAGQAFDAFKKYQELEPKNTLMTLDQNVGLFQLYDMYYNRGVQGYNKKDYTTAFNNMKNAVALEEYISGKGFSYNNFTFPKLDTQLINLTASSAYLAKKEDESIPYFQKLTDAKLSGKEYKEIYGLVAQYYLNKGDQANADKYLGYGRELYPNDQDYWIGIEFGNPGDDKEKRLAKYQQMVQKYPDNYALSMDYATELYNYIYANDKKPTDYAQKQQELQSVLTKTMSLNANSALANYVMSQQIYNQIYDIEDAQRAIKGNTPAAAAQRKDNIAKLNAKYDELAQYSQKAFDLYSAETNMKPQDKANLRRVTDQLIEYYQRKKQNDKVAFYQDKLKSM
ncbi:MAG TPA: hypothetical protein VNS32_14545 [Flavisolibacter sp.]|nr:hypothetical protein [Flavisolibacter sp.]